MGKPRNLGDGRWQVRVYVGVPGKRELTKVVRAKRATDPAISDAELELRVIRDQLRDRDPSHASIDTVGDLVELLIHEKAGQWQPNSSRSKVGWSPQHAQNRRSLFNRYIREGIGEKLLVDRLTPKMFEAHINSLPVRSRTARVGVKTLLSQAFSNGIRHGLWHREIPTEHIEIQWDAPKQREVPDATQVEQLVHYLHDPSKEIYWRAYLAVLLGSGLRRSEILALKWRAPELEDGFNQRQLDKRDTPLWSWLEGDVIHVRSAVITEEGLLGMPKSKRSVRDVPIPQFTIDLLDQWRIAAELIGETRLPDFVFPRRMHNLLSLTEPGRRRRTSTWFKDEIQPLIGSEITGHSLRAHAVSVWRTQMDAADAAAIGGHDIEVASRHYVASLGDLQDGPAAIQQIVDANSKPDQTS